MTAAMERLRSRQQEPASGQEVYDPLAAIVVPKFVSQKGNVVDLPVDKLRSFTGHTFKLRPMESEYMLSLRDSIRENGVLEPLLVRPCPDEGGYYEIIAGHTRHFLAKDIGLPTVPCCIKDLNDQEAVIQMGETNVQRPDWLPSERALTYKAHLEAIQKSRAEEVEPGSTLISGKSRDVAAQRWGISGKMLEMYVRMASLLPDLLEMVDTGRIAVKGGYALSFLSKEDQWYLHRLLATHPQVTVNEAKAVDMKTLGHDSFRRILNLDANDARISVATWKIPIARTLVPSNAKDYLSDPELQEQIAKVVNEYISNRENQNS